MAVRWFSMSTQFLTDPKVEDLGEKFGPAGPLVIVALLGRAKIADDAGRVTCSFRTLGNEAFVDRSTAKEVVTAAGDSGLVEVTDLGEADVSLRFPAFRRWQDAGRKAKDRESDKPSPQANVRTRPDPSGDVPTDRQTDRQERQEKKKGSTASRRDVPPEEFDDWLAHYHRVTGRVSVTGSKGARDAFKARRRENKSVEDLKLATVGCQADPWRVEKGHNVPETILRASNVEGYISQAKDRPGPVAVAPQVEPSPEAEQAWAAAQPGLQKRLQQSAYQMWIAPISVAGRDGDRIVLAAPGAIRTWVERRYLEVVMEAIEGFSGIQWVEVPGLAAAA